MNLLSLLSLAWIGVAVMTALVLVQITAPYGRHVRRGWGPAISHRLGWVIMELVSPIALTVTFVGFGGLIWSGSGILLVAWLAHYVNRAVVYPIRARWEGRRMPVLIAGSAVFFNVVNGTLNGWGLAVVEPGGITMVAGVAIFFVGAAINIRSDEVLMRLRRRGDGGYEIPRGGLYDHISCPNYLGEIIEWIGFAVAAWSLPALSFAIWTAANLAPRAIAHHRWYHETFPDYPSHRRALIPGIL